MTGLPLNKSDSQNNSQNNSPRYIQIDDEGYFKLEELRVSDAEAGRQWLSSLTIDEQGRAWTNMEGQAPVLVEFFDQPYIVLDVEKGTAKKWSITLPYGHQESFSLNTLTLDPWDRFHGLTSRGIPFVFSRSSQARFFNLLDEFEDDAIVVDGERLEIRTWMHGSEEVRKPEWWTSMYNEQDAPWDLGGPHPALAKLVPQLKLPRLRILVPGAGAGHDAAWLASQGHIVTALDFSEEAIARAKAKYGDMANLKFERADVFNLPAEMNSSFDLVFEHTLYCAIQPTLRNDLVRVWKRALADQGHLLGVFFSMHRPKGPPYGGSEWELRSRLGKSFRPLYWMRLRDESTAKLGTEFLVYTQKLATF